MNGNSSSSSSDDPYSMSKEQLQSDLAAEIGGSASDYKGNKSTLSSILTNARQSTKRMATEISKTVLEELECSVCCDTVCAPIMTCSNGHLTCKECRGKLTTKVCLTCQVSVENSKLVRNRVVEKIAADIEIECEFVHEGKGCCGAKIGHADLSSHRQKCKFRPIPCCDSDCTQVFSSWAALIDHRVSNHITVLVNSDRVVNSAMFVDGSTNWLSLLRVDGFEQWFYLNSNSFDSYYVFTVRCLGYNPEEFRVEWTFRNKNDGSQLLGPYNADTIDARIDNGEEKEKMPTGCILVLKSAIEKLAEGKTDNKWEALQVDARIKRKAV